MLDVANFGSLSIVRRVVSSVKIAIVVLSVVGKSAVYSKYSEGPYTLPCGTPDFTSL
jgi:hypothetical protein